MNTASKHRVANALGWCLVGGLSGLAIAFLVFLKTPAVFESDAIVQVRRGEVARSSPSTTSDPSGQSGVQARELSGLHMSDDAADDQFVYHPADTEGRKQASSESRSPAPGDDFDDSVLLGSQKLLAEAIERAGLADLTVLAGGTGATDVNVVAREIQQAGDLKVRQVRRSSQGEVYRITFRAGQPDASQRVVDALLQSANGLYQQPVESGSWQEAIPLLSDVRMQIDQRIDDLLSETHALQVPEDAMLWERDVESQLSLQLQQLNQDLNRIHEEAVWARQQLQLAEVLREKGLASKAVLATLMGRRSNGLPSREETEEPDAGDQAEERKAWLKKRDKFMKELNAELKPLEDELEQMLTKYAAKHPAIIYQRAQISRLKSRLFELPPDPAEPSEEERPSETPDENRDELDQDAETALMSLLKGLHARQAEVELETQTLEEQRTSLISRLARQKVALLRAKELSRELQQQQGLRADLLARLGEIERPPRSRPCSLEILRAAGVGSRIEPQLNQYLLMGGGGGVLVGLLLGGFLSVFAVNSPPESTASDRSERND